MGIMAYSFDLAKAPSTRKTQYFEMLGNRAIYQDGWIAVTTPLRFPWITIGAESSPDDFKWELYHVAEDFTEANNLAAQNPAKLKELQKVFDREAKKYNVYPLQRRHRHSGGRGLCRPNAVPVHRQAG